MRCLTPSWKRAALGLVFIAGCEVSRSTPAAPTPVPSPGTPPATSAATIAVENLFAIVHGQGTYFWYDVRFLLRETSGASGARIDGIAIYGPGGSYLTGPGCWRNEVRVPAGGTLDTFYTDAGALSLAFCAPLWEGTTASATLETEVTFRDDRGIAGSIRVPIVSLR